jgi:hypothetical protein
MAKKKPLIKIESFGRYSKWNKESRELPHIEEFTEEIIAREDVEFGMILHISGGKGIKLDYRIKHPPFKDKTGNIETDFTGVYYINSNDYRFYIGDCIWTPIEDKCGTWHIIIELEKSIVAEKKFLLKQS